MTLGIFIRRMKWSYDCFPPSAQGQDQLLDAMIRQKMAEQGMAVVDLERLTELQKVIDELKQAVKSLR